MCRRRSSCDCPCRSAACSWVMIPVSPWARVSWISLAIRCRSSSTPASRAWASSWSCRPCVLLQDRLEPPVGLAQLLDHLLALVVLLRGDPAEPGQRAGHAHVDADDDQVDNDRPGRPVLRQAAVLRGRGDQRDERHAGRPGPAGRQVERVQVSGEGEEAVPRRPQDQQRHQDGQDDEEDRHPPRPLPPGRMQGEAPQHPRPGGRGQAQVDQQVAGGLAPLEDHRHGGDDHQHDVGQRGHGRLFPPFP